MLSSFHKSVANWFTREFTRPTDAQALAWPAIRKREHTLIAAPTGSGKTLAAFLATIDDLVRQGLDGRLTNRTQVVYVSPLKALSNDIERNLQRPLQGVRDELREMGLPDAAIRVLVRTGDTPSSQRTAMLKNPPHILVTTPESLYLLLTSDGGRKMLADVHTLIVDEIHALVRDKRGSHLALSIERLQSLVGRPLVRIGLSATQKPIEAVARFLVGSDPANADGPVRCTIVDTGHTRPRDLGIEVPGSPLTAVMAGEVWEEVYARLLELIQEHRTTLIFVNTRKMAERIAFQLREKIGTDLVASHHGSMSREHRLDAEQKLKSGALRALVATASLELGIDIGSVDLVCQIGSPKSIAAFLQRVGRSGHTIAGTPKGRLFPLSRDELVECAAMLDAVRREELDRIVIPEKPLDILAQQIVAEAAARECGEDEFFELARRAWPYRNLARSEYDELLTMLSEGFTHRRGKSGAYLHHDAVNRRFRGRRGARLTALTSGGAIPDTFDYDVILEPTNTFVGTLNEDYAIESMAGDIFQLGNNSWRILRIENGIVRVADAHGAAPTIPFWLGEAPGRSVELSRAVSRLREDVSQRLGNLDELANAGQSPDGVQTDRWKRDAMTWLTRDVGLGEAAADQLVTYLALARVALNAMPTQTNLVMERFFDEAGDMHLVIHSPYGSRLNRAWGLSLRKRFCRKFNFELQAAATEDAIVLSLGSTHSFPLEEVVTYLNAKTVRGILIQAMLDSPMWEVRWRWNASRALAILRRHSGKRVPAQIQRMNAQDLVAQVFPDQLACLENIAGDREVPDHPLVNQTVHDCLTEAMAIDELEDLLRKIEAGSVTVVARDLREASPLAQEILNARPYAFLDDAPLEERRTRAVAGRSWLDPSEARDLGRLDPAAIDAVRTQVWPDAESADELHDALLTLGFLTRAELEKGDGFHDWKSLLSLLEAAGRAGILRGAGVELVVSTERLPMLRAVHPEGVCAPNLIVPEKFDRPWAREKALVEIVRGRLEGLGPVTVSVLADALGVPPSEVSGALLALEGEGFVFRGTFTTGAAETEWCERRLLARIHRYTLEKLRREIEPVSASDFMRFLFDWHRVLPGQRPEGPEALHVVLHQLEGYEAPAASWESDILPARMEEYDFTWLDMACLSGKTVWARFRARAAENGKTSGPVKMTPIMLVDRGRLDFWKRFACGSGLNQDTLAEPTRRVLECLEQRGALFFDELVERSGLLRSQAEDALGELVALGRVTSDSFGGLRALLLPAKYKLDSSSRRPAFTMTQAGRWSLLDDGMTEHSADGDDAAETVARILLRRYGVVFRRLTDKEMIAPPWRELVRVLRRLEARGEVRGGRFVEGVWGEQYALPEAVTKLRAVRREPKNGHLLSLSAVDPLNLHGILTPGKRVASLTGNRVLYRDGVVSAVYEGGEAVFVERFDDQEKWAIQKALIQKHIPPRLRAYLGKGIG